MRRVQLGGHTVAVASRELVFPALALVFCGIYYIDVRDLPQQSVLYAGPLVLLTAALALTVFVAYAIRIDPDMVKGDSTRMHGMVGFIRTDNLLVGRAVSVLALTVTYLFIINVQFAFATVLFLAACVYALGERNGRVIVTYSIGLTAVLYGVFVLWLEIPL